MRRNRTAVSAAAVALVMAVIGLGVVSAVLTTKNAALDLQRRRVEDREQLAIAAVRRFLDAVIEDPVLKNSEGLKDLRNSPLKGPLAFFRSLRDQLLADRDTRPEAQVQLAMAVHDYAHLTNEIGDKRDGLKAHEDSLAIRQELAREDPAKVEYQAGLAGIQNCRGDFLRATGQPEAALRSYEQARAIRERLVRQQPKALDYASDLRGTLNHSAVIDLGARRFQVALERFTQAIVWQKKALATNPRNPEYRRALANHLGDLIRAARGLGRDEEVERAQRELDELKANDPRFAALDARLAAVAKGEAPRDNPERLALAQRAYDLGRHALAARLWAEALQADPKLADDRRAQQRYNASCAAALAAGGQGIDEPPPDASAKAKLRNQALGWLKAELSAWARLVESRPPQAKSFVAQTLDHWKRDTDLAGVRDPQALEKLPEAERAAWRGLWGEVDALRARLGNGKAGP
ncbi:MAG: hypothetical protein U0835_21190 [Isosphaeraceae bacterium]